jgi:hypothetical protein
LASSCGCIREMAVDLPSASSRGRSHPRETASGALTLKGDGAVARVEQWGGRACTSALSQTGRLQSGGRACTGAVLLFGRLRLGMGGHDAGNLNAGGAADPRPVSPNWIGGTWAIAAPRSSFGVIV